MKNALLYLFFFTYSANIVKPAIPYAADLLAHTFYYAQHVRTVHMENGKYHVHNELVKQTNQHGSDDSDAYLKKISLPDEHLFVHGMLSFFNPPFIDNYYSPCNAIQLTVYVNSIYAPPRC